MKRVLGSISGLSLAFLVAACGGDKTTDDAGTGGTGASGGSGASGGTAGMTAGKAGSGSGATGGTTAPSTGGTGSGGTGTSTGGTGATAGTGNAQGGAPGTGGTGTGGTTAAGSGGTGIGGDGSGGVGTGGSEPGSGGSPMGGSGGDAPMAGMGGMGGEPPVEPQVITTASGAAWKTDGTLTEVTSGNADVTVNDNAMQTFTGFGGTFNEKGWDALMALSEADRARAIKLLFDPYEGAKFVYGRIPIGASDYANNRYTLNEMANDAMQTNFSIERDKMKLIPYIKAAAAVNPNIHFWGSPWTPPTWMKTGGQSGGFDRGNMRDDPTVLQSFAIYLAKFVEEYGKEGITIKTIHPQNEPGYAQDYPSCVWSGALFAKFIAQYLGPTFQERNVAADIFIGTMSNNMTDGSVLQTTQSNATAKGFVKGYGLQWGMLDTYSSLGMDTSLQIWQTEHKCGNYPWVSGTNQSRAPNDRAYAVESWGLIRDWIRKGVNSYSAWNMVLDTVGRSLDTVRPWAQNAPLVVDIQAKTLQITDTYYVFRHVSQYVDPGAKVVGTSGGDALAFKNPDGTVVVAMYNSGGAKQAIVSIGGKKLQFAMPGSGWATVNYK